jgi:L-fuconolactonase
MLQPSLTPALRAMVEQGLAFDALVRPVHLAPLLQLCLRHPDLRVVVDHAAKPDIAAAAWQPWADALARIAWRTQAACKLSGLLTEAGAAPAPQAARRWTSHVLACFGARRVMWGSDWPVLELAANYQAWWNETQALLGVLNPRDRAEALGGTAQRVYRL